MDWISNNTKEDITKDMLGGWNKIGAKVTEKLDSSKSRRIEVVQDATDYPTTY